MTQKLIESKRSLEDLMQRIDPKGIADESVHRTIEILLNLVEELNSKVKYFGVVKYLRNASIQTGFIPFSRILADISAITLTSY